MEDTGKTIALIKALGGSGGGSGLPTPTADDVGKVATVIGEQSKGAIIVPEQNAFVSDEPITLSNANVLLFTQGANVIVTVSQIVSGSKVTVERTATVDNYYSVTVTLPDGNTTLEIYENSGGLDCVADGIEQGTSAMLSIAVNLVNVDASWGMGGGGSGGDNRFIVTLTPTALDYSGTMDKTVAEIDAAYEAGQEIWFNMSARGASFLFPLKLVVETSNHYPAMQGDAIMPDTNRLVVYGISSTDDGTKQTYGTKIFTLTPAT